MVALGLWICGGADTSTTWVHESTDCDDTDPETNPAAGEVVDNGIDDDCDPSTLDVVDTGDTDTGADTDTSVVDTEVESDRPYDSLVDTAIEPPLGEACGCAPGGTSGTGLFGLALALMVRRRRGSVVRGPRRA